jgi:type III secretion protein U
MKKAAMEYDIPIMENVPLAHALYDLADIGHYIPLELIEPVAEVICWVRERKRQASAQLTDSDLSNLPNLYSN